MNAPYLNLRILLACGVGLTLGSMALQAAVTLTENRTLPAGDMSLDGQEVIVDGARLTVAGLHGFARLQLRNGAILNHPAAPSGLPENAIRLTIAGDLSIDASSRVDVSGLGYAEPTSPGAGTRGDFAGSGGGYGGRGSRGAGGAPGVGGDSHGSIVAPDSWGGPGANGSDGAWAPGGGLVHLEVGGIVDVAGTIRADGGNAWVNNQGGGAGGTVFLKATTLRGSGSISANGGAGEYVDGGGGAGGRIALLFVNNEFTGAITAHGAGGAGIGGAGTIYLKPGTSPGEVRIANTGWGEWTPVAAPVPFDLALGSYAIAYPTEVLKLGNLTIQANAMFTHLTGDPGLVVEAVGSITIAEGGRIAVDGRGFPIGNDGGPGSPAAGGWAGAGAGHGGLGADSASGNAGGPHYGSMLEPTQLGSAGAAGNSGPGSAGGGAIRLTAGAAVIVDGRLTADGLPATVNNAGGGSGGSIWVAAASLSGAGVISANGGAGEYVDGGGGAGGRIALYYGTSEFSGTATAYGAGGSQRGGAGTLYRRQQSDPYGQLVIHNGDAWGNYTPLTSPVPFELTLAGRANVYPVSPLLVTRLELHTDSILTHLSGQTNLHVRVLGDAALAAGGAIAVDGRGYRSGDAAAPGVGLTRGCCGSGGGHGGLGGISTSGAPGGVHYDSVLEPVDRGSQGGDSTSGAGFPGGGAIRLIVDRQLRIDGRLSANGGSSSINNSGGGAGGSIWVTAGSLTGAGVISANGGAGEYVDGGGGGGGRIALHYGSSDFAGTVTAFGGGGSQRAGAGTIYRRVQSAPYGHVLVDNGGVWGNDTPLLATEPFQLTLAEMASVWPQSELLTLTDLDIRTNAVLTHLTGQAKCSVHVLHNLTLAEGGVISADGRGYPVGDDRGPGAGGGSGGVGSGAGHGGQGARSANGVAGGLAYGGVVTPVSLGSEGGPGAGGAGGAGGGALYLVVDNEFALDGRVSANGSSTGANNAGGGSGGSIYVNATTLSGTGLVAADGGNGEYVDGGGGAGGRIALHYAQNSFAGSVVARGGGGSARGGAGSIYTRRRGETDGTLVLDNGGNPGALSPIDLPLNARLVVAGGTIVYPVGLLDVVSLHLKPGATVTHTNGQSGLHIRVAGDLIVDADARLTANGLGYPVGDNPGPGAGQTGSAAGGGGAHGGNGGLAWPGDVSGGVGYDSVLEPTDFGSSGGGGGGPGNARSPGGGAIRVVVGGSFTLNGAVTADGTTAWYNNQGGGAGGSVWITADRLLGAGTLSVNGGTGEYVDGGGGGGGRIALHLGANGFSGTLLAHGGGGHQKGGAGTIYTRLANETVGRVLVDNRDAWGTYTPLVALEPFHLTIANRAQVYPEGTLTVGSLSVETNTVLTHLTTQDALNVVVLGDASLAGVIDVSGRGYPRGADDGPGAGGQRDWAGSGAGHGGLGGTSSTSQPGGTDYGSATEPTALGSRGGSGSGGPGGAGGGAVRLIVGQTLTLDGTINANGSAGTLNNAGGGSGGSVFLTARTFTGGGHLTANGGPGEYVDGGGGSGGRIAVYRTADTFSGAIVATGAGGSARGEDGTIHKGAVGGLVWLSPPADWIAGETPLEVAFFTGQSGPATVAFRVWRDGVASPLAQVTGNLTASASWNTTAVPDGRYELEASVFDAGGPVAVSGRQEVAVQNAVVWHAGALTASETWEASQVHAVRRDVTVGTGQTLTLAPGAVVKFLPGTRLMLSSGATLATPATATQPVLLTSFLDDSAGGDSNLDGATTRPQPGSWRFVLNAGATFAPNQHTHIRYHSQSYGGTLTADDTWSGDSLREITDTVVVPSGVTLRIEAGAIVKFASGRGLNVNAGGTLVVNGTAVEPVVFTSIRDDAFGGDTNGDGSRSVPAAGDWRSLRFADGATATIDHAQIRFGGNSIGNPWGAGGAIEALGSPLTVRNSVIVDALKDGAFCYGTTRFENGLILRCDRGLTAVGTMDIVNCTVDQCRIGLLEHVGQLNVRNTIVSRSIDAGIEHDAGGGVPVVTSCNVWNPDARRGNYSGVTDRSGRDGNISAQPLYKDADNDNFRLNFTSPGIDAADGAIAPATDFAGTPRYDDPRTGNTGTPAANGALPDIGAYEFAETAPSNLDLVVAGISGPAQLTAGQIVRLEWTILNRGADAFSGPWHDAIFLRHATTGERLWVGEPLVGRGATLGPGQTHTASADIRVPGGVAGDYRWVVEANCRADVFEGANTANNQGTSTASSSLAVPLLPLDGPPVAASFAAQEEAQWFQVLAPAGRDVRVTLDLAAVQGVTELYVGRGFMPTTETYSARQREWSAPDTTAIASGAHDDPAGSRTNTFYVLAIGRVLAGVPQNFQLSAAGAAFSLDTVSPSVIGNAGLVTLVIRGAALTTNTAFTLRNGNASQVALRRSVRESGRAFATFDLAGFPVGRADVMAEADGLQVVLPQGVEVVAGGTPDFYASLSGPGTTRAGRFMTWFVTYGNRGLIDLKLPLLRFSVPGATEIQLYESTLNWADSFVFWGLNPEALLPTLGPGQEVTFEVRLKTMVNTQMTLAMMTGEQFAADTTRFNWSAIPPAPGADPARWAQMVSNLEARLGPTVGEYSARLEADLAELTAGLLRYKYLANLNGAWLLGDELRGLPTAYPIIDIPPELEDPSGAPALHTPPKKIPGDGIRRTWFVIITMEDYRIARLTGGHPGAADTDNVAADSEDLWNYLRKDLRVPEEQSTGGHDAPGDDATWNRDTILAAIRSFAGKADADDNLVIVYSGHGGRGRRAGTGYLVGNGSDVSPVAFTQAIDDVGAGTTYFINNSCHSEAFNELVNPGNTTFVGYAATKKDRIAWSDEAGSPMIAGLKGQLRKCNGLAKSLDTTTTAITKEFKDETDEKDRQSPVLTNPSGVSLEGKPWNDPAGIEDILNRTFRSLPFPGIVAAGTFTIVGSVDPNDKYALAGVGSQRWVHTDQVLPFEIVFENKTNAPAPAQEVLVIDDLDPHLDGSTFELKSITFNDARIEVPPGLQRYTTTATVSTDPYEVTVEAGLNPVTGRLTWLLRSRDPATGDLPEDPFAGFLPPNGASHRGEGSLTYTIRPRLDLADGTQLTNRATIIFDPTYGANPPILTPWVTNTIDAIAPSSAVQPLPAMAVGEVPVSWSGQDAPGGSGIASYDIYASANAAPYTGWLIATTNTTTRFVGTPGTTYRFYSIARDAAGNSEAAPSLPDATVTIGGGTASVEIARQDDQIRVTFQGVLESAPTIRGPWTEVPGAVSPHLAAPSSVERYYRARR